MRKKTFLKKLSIKKIAYANASKINKRKEREDSYLCFVLTTRLQFIKNKDIWRLDRPLILFLLKLKYPYW